MTIQNRAVCQLRIPCTPRTGREFAYCTVRHTPTHTPEAIEVATNIPVKRLIKISAPTGDAIARPEEVAAICRATRRFEWLRFFARQAGCELFELPDADSSDADAEVLEHTRATLQRVSAMVDTLAAIAGDKQIDPQERLAWKDVLGQLQARLASVDGWVDARSTREVAPRPEIRRAR